MPAPKSIAYDEYAIDFRNKLSNISNMVELKYSRIPAYSVVPKGRFNQYDWTGSSYGCPEQTILKGFK